jgi:hypothetical protein
MKTFLFVSLLAVATANAASTGITVPNGDQFVDQNAENDYPFGVEVPDVTTRYQQVYDASQFAAQIPNGGLITEIDFRVDGPHGFSFASTLPDIQINLSTTAKGPDSLSPIFSANLGGDDTVVVGRGQVFISSSVSMGGPYFFDVRFLLSTPFLYRPGAGNLLMDVRSYGGTGSIDNVPPFDAVNVVGDSVSRVLATHSDATTATVVDSLGLVTQFQVTPVSEPSSVTLLLLGTGALAIFIQRSRTG